MIKSKRCLKILVEISVDNVLTSHIFHDIYSSTLCIDVTEKIMHGEKSKKHEQAVNYLIMTLTCRY